MGESAYWVVVDAELEAATMITARVEVAVRPAASVTMYSIVSVAAAEASSWIASTGEPLRKRWMPRLRSARNEFLALSRLACMIVCTDGRKARPAQAGQTNREEASLDFHGPELA
jgi:hypothetical protein